MFRLLFLSILVFLKTVVGDINDTATPLYYQTLHKEIKFSNNYGNDSQNETKQSYWASQYSFASTETKKFYLSQILSAVPSYEESLPVRSTNEQCAKHSKFVLQSANQLELWALSMIDSSGKIPAGLLKGNINQLGDFDQCVNVQSVYENRSLSNAVSEAIYGKYCLAAIDFTLPPAMKTIDTLIHSHYVIRSKITDLGHRIPKFANMYWALCVPHSCTNDDVKEWLVQHLQKIEIPGLKKEVLVDDFMCKTKSRTNRITFATALTIIGLSSVIVLTLTATFANEQRIKEAIILCKGFNSKLWYILLESFSLKKNFKSLISLSGPPDDVACLHGIRTLNAIALLLSHKCMQLLFYSYVNRTQLAETISYPYSMLARSAIVYTDSFILISGCLAAQCFLKNFDRKSGGIIKNYVNRFFRLTPNLAAIILFCTFILPLLNDGPLWNVVVSKHAELCHKYWWRNILYVHNYYGFEEMCLTHTHQLGIDMQLYISSPILIYILWRSPTTGIIVSGILATISTYLRYYVTYQHNLSPIIYYGVSVSQLFNTATLSYILPTHRATVYIMGVLLGYYLHYHSSVPLKLSKAQVNIGTFFFSTCGFLAMFGPYWMSDRNYKYNNHEAALYMAISPIMWCSALIWGILINVHGYTGIIGEFFKWPGFRIFTRIAYAVYLIQFPVYFYNVGTAKSPTYFTTQVLLNIEEYAIIFALSIVLTLLFDLPFQNISKRLSTQMNKNADALNNNNNNNNNNKIVEKMK